MGRTNVVQSFLIRIFFFKNVEDGIDQNIPDWDFAKNVFFVFLFLQLAN